MSRSIYGIVVLALLVTGGCTSEPSSEEAQETNGASAAHELAGEYDSWDAQEGDADGWPAEAQNLSSEGSEMPVNGRTAAAGRQGADPFQDGWDGGQGGGSWNAAGQDGGSMNAQGRDGSGSGARVAIVDRGFRMTRGTQAVPKDWTLRQDIATNPQTGQSARYFLEIRGPSDELIKSLGISAYNEMMGTRFEHALQQMVANGLRSEVQNVSIGNLQRSPLLERMPEFQKGMRLARSKGMELQALEAPVKGRRGGTEVRAVLYVGHFTSASMPGVGTVNASVVIAPPERLESAIRTNEQIAHSYRANPQFEQRMMQVSAAAMRRQNAEHRQRMASSQQQHRQRMANNQRQFDAHQARMRDQSAASDQQHQQWVDNFRNSGSSAWSGSDYTGHEAFVDGIHERSSFDDPYSGYQVQQDGQYDYWYQNGLGEYYGTDDPSFDPNSMTGDWQQIEPLQPNR